MCGIAGILDPAGVGPPASGAEALAMARRLRHRGPDGQRSWVSPTGRSSLGHARLEVIDLETGDQPMGNEDGSVQVVFNGEIYNFATLRRTLERAGHVFRSRSDTEVLVHGYEEWGDTLPERLDGMFAFVVWDERRGRALLARDRAGKKPLFWCAVGQRVAFASEIKGLRALDWIPHGIDPGALPYYLIYGYVPQPRTFFEEIRVLPPAHRMVVSATAPPVPELYWDLRWRRPEAGFDERRAAVAVRGLLSDAVEKRLVSDVPLGAFLSGGIDSTIVVGLMRERIEGPIRTFSLGFADDPTYDETSFAREAARRFGTEHTEFTVEAHEVGLVDELVEAHDQPFGDSSAIPTFIVSRLTREHVTVALTGDGGDELFAGYPRFLGMSLAERVPRSLAGALARSAGLLPHRPNFRHPVRRLQRFLSAIGDPPVERMIRWIGLAPDPDSMLRPEFRASVSRTDLLASFRKPWEETNGNTALTRALALNFDTYLPEDLLVKADRCSMAHGLELRSPFLDTALMEFAAGLPDRARHRGHRPRTMKRILREAFSDVLPERIRARGKMGFGVPLPIWFRTHWRSMFEERVLSPERAVWEWLARDSVLARWEEHQASRADHGHLLWGLLTLQVWLERR